MIKYIMFNAIFGGVVWLAYIGYQPAITVFKILAVVSGLIMLLYWSVLKLLKRQRGTGDLKAALDRLLLHT